jgi:lysophospholipase L1-like esterase
LELGEGYRVAEEGLCGRTILFEDPYAPYRNGTKHLPVVLETHAPIAVLVIMLGTNDLKSVFNLSPFAIGKGMEHLVSLAKKSELPIDDILIVSPPHVTRTGNLETGLTFEGAISKSKELAQYYQYVASQFGVHFFDAAAVAEASVIDGVHIDEAGHEALGKAIAAEIQRFTAHRE